jgi:hypothetical protein
VRLVIGAPLEGLAGRLKLDRMPHPRTIAAFGLTGLLLAGALLSNAAGAWGAPPAETPTEATPPPPEPAAKQKDRCRDGLQCFALNILCVGKFVCHEPAWYGCARGVCAAPGDY